MNVRPGRQQASTRHGNGCARACIQCPMPDARPPSSATQQQRTRRRRRRRKGAVKTPTGMRGGARVLVRAVEPGSAAVEGGAADVGLRRRGGVEQPSAASLSEGFLLPVDDGCAWCGIRKRSAASRRALDKKAGFGGQCTHVHQSRGGPRAHPRTPAPKDKKEGRNNRSGASWCSGWVREPLARSPAGLPWCLDSVDYERAGMRTRTQPNAKIGSRHRIKSTGAVCF